MSRTISGTGSTANDIVIANALNWSSGALTVNAANIIVNAPLCNTGAGAINLQASAAVALNAGIGSAGAIAIGAATGLTQAVSTTITSSTGLGINVGKDSTASGIIGGAGGLTKSGAGTLTLSGTNTYTGATMVNAGTLAISNAAGLGATTAGTTVASGATLDLQNVSMGAEAVTLNGGTLQTSTGGSSLSGVVTLGDASIFNVASDASLNVTGMVTAAGNALSVSGAGNLALGNIANTLDGGVSVSSSHNILLTSAGALRLNEIAATGTINVATLAGNLTIAGNIATTDAGASAITLNAGQSSAAGVSTGGDLIFNGDSTLGTGVNGTATLYTGSLTGSTGLAALIGGADWRWQLPLCQR